MDDLEFRRRCVANPFDRDEVFLRKTRESPEHAQFVERQARFDRQLKAIMIDVAVPEGLEARIKLRHSLQQRQFASRFWKRSCALAAGLIIAAGVVILLILPRDGLQDAVLAHVYHELHHLIEQNSVTDARLQSVLSTAGGRLAREFDRVNYAGTCQIRHREGVHLVLKGRVGPVTVLLMPGEHIARRDVIEDARFKGIIVPTPNGSMAILGESGEPLQDIELKVLSAIVWKSET